MQFNEARFNRHIENMGQKVLWRRAFVCPCVNPQSGQHDTACPHCRGKGRLYEAPQETVCGIAGQKTQNEWAKLGQFTPGDVVVTIPGSSAMWDSAGNLDRVTLRNAIDKFTATLTRGGPGELLLFQPERLERVMWRHPQTKALVEGGLPKVEADGKLTWGDRAPPPGTTYSLTGRRYSEYHVFGDMPSNRNMHQGSKRLPKLVVLRRYDLAQR